MLCVIVIEPLCCVMSSTHTIDITTSSHLVIQGVIQRRRRVGLIVHSVQLKHYVIYLFLGPLGSSHADTSFDGKSKNCTSIVVL
jgi:hypothetical protein